MRYLARFLLLMAAFALTTAGLMAWRDAGFAFDGVWPLEGEPRLHALHLLMLGLAMIPPAIWELFLLERAMPQGRVTPTSAQHRRVGDA